MLLVYGGSFNPPTIAHYAIAKFLIKKYSCDLVFVPVGNSYSKDDLAPFIHRYRMLEIISKDLGCNVSKIDDTKEYLGTYEILKILSNIDKDIYFIMGADNLKDISRWKNADKLIKEFKFIILTRGDIDCNSLVCNLDYKENFIIEKIDLDISSTSFREEKNENVIPTQVLDYIKDNNLYEV